MLIEIIGVILSTGPAPPRPSSSPLSSASSSAPASLVPQLCWSAYPKASFFCFPQEVWLPWHSDSHLISGLMAARPATVPLAP